MIISKTNAKRRAILGVALVLALAFSLAGCNASTNTPASVNSALNKVSQGLYDVTQATASLQSTVIQAQQMGLISVNDAREIIGVCIRILQADQQASDTVRKLSALDDQSKTSVLAVLQPIIDLVSNTVNSGLAGIKNPDTKAKVQLGLLTVQTTLNSIQVILAAKGAN